MKNKLIKKLILLRMLGNNISGNLYENKEVAKKIKNKTTKPKSNAILNQIEQEGIKENTESTELNPSKNEKKDLLIVYIDKKYLNKSASEIVKKWCQSIKILNYKIIDNFNTLSVEISKQPKAILSCEEVEFFLNQNLRIQIVRGFELRFKGIPLVFTYLPISQIKNPTLKKEIWQDLKIIKGIIKYG
ncbi:hypothetical protein LKV13_00060 [Borrelia sp. BU AG58]|uniref:hypothetical protein n=1 Tax=Borrelia sp. BU AG58 TaxID=2887345 RepID=UPI001E3A3AC7|nr:hypothetical protein [Borrelia sp. BU AG58]UER67237.1 hypothetical protein LKV13_00060 [Borrelia sp. BU AG58]